MSSKVMPYHENSMVLKGIFAVCLVVPFSIDIFLSSLPAMKIYFHGANTTLIMSVFLLGFAISQPIYGPLLDRFGRRPVLLTGLFIYVISSFFLMFVHSFELLLLARFIQAMGACSSVVAIPTIARDLYEKEKLVQAISFIMALIGISPILAPLLGSILTSFFYWRASFIFLFILGVFFLIFIGLFLKETIAKKNTDALNFKHIIQTYWNLAKQKSFILPCFFSGISYAIMFSYFGLSSVFIIQQMHLSVVSYGLLLALNAVPIILMSIMTPKFAKIFSLSRIIQLGFYFILLGATLIWILNSYFLENIYILSFPMFIVTIGIGLIRPSASASALGAVDKKNAGFASAFYNFFSFLSGSLASAVSSKYIQHISVFGMIIFSATTLTLIILSVYSKPRKHTYIN
jgi:DHA1 family bicyclomycin/chloramphenicol resistance-like MFS transporter